ncbi:MAG: sugar phosphate isomerase/epimerase [Clostridia bacterium]|nr:sugar phosphate isomerase/epimerase [Clostridia bacterium]
MDLSINLSYFIKGYTGGGRPGWVKEKPDRTLEEALSLVKELGYTKIDYNGNGAGGRDGDEIKSVIDSFGIKVNQSHAPDNFWAQKPTEDFINELLASISLCRKLGSEIYVVHGDQIDRKNMEYSEQAVLEYNYRVYFPVVEYAASHGMKVAFENTIDMPPHRVFCSHTEELLALTEKFSDSKSVGICWDFGHGNVMYDPNSIEEMIKTKDHLISTHVHDNFHSKDMHGLPFTGNLDWTKMMKALKDIGYKGDFTYEFVYNNYPDEFFMDFMRLAYRAGEYLLSL